MKIEVDFCGSNFLINKINERLNLAEYTKIDNDVEF